MPRTGYLRGAIGGDGHGRGTGIVFWGGAGESSRGTAKTLPLQSGNAAMAMIGMDDTEQRGRHSIRLPGYDYGRAGTYFLTICTQGRLHLFGEVREGVMLCSAAGYMVQEAFYGLEEHFPTVHPIHMAAMPDHVHALIQLSGVYTPSGQRPTLGEVVGWYKQRTHLLYGHEACAGGWPCYQGHLWQRDFYERRVETAAALVAYAQYMVENPQRWSETHDE